jgi:acetate CoA/acetoacetate CoA-transferase alpha subunit
MKGAVTAAEAAALIADGATLLVGGFMGVGTSERMMDALVAAGRRDLTIVCNDAGRPGIGVAKLISARLVRRAIVSHIGLNPELQRQMIAGETQVELVPQGTLAERIRAGGHGLGGVLTRTAIGTIAAEGKQICTIDGVDYLVERPIRGDVAILMAKTVDYLGNCATMLTATNFNPVMALAADLTIVEGEDIVPTGVIPPDAVRIPGVLIDRILKMERKQRKAA